jgi:hypothetical protein
MNSIGNIGWLIEYVTSYNCLGVAYELIDDLHQARLNYSFATFLIKNRRKEVPWLNYVDQILVEKLIKSK